MNNKNTSKCIIKQLIYNRRTDYMSGVFLKLFSNGDEHYTKCKPCRNNIHRKRNRGFRYSN